MKDIFQASYHKYIDLLAAHFHINDGLTSTEVTTGKISMTLILDLHNIESFGESSRLQGQLTTSIGSHNDVFDMSSKAITIVSGLHYSVKYFPK